MASLKRFLLEDLGTKVLALILALAVYVHVLSGQDRELTYRIPLRVAPLPSGLAIGNEVPDHLRVRVRASGKDLLKLRTQRFHAEVRMDASRPGRLQRPILGSDVILPKGVEVTEVEILDPSTLELILETAERGRLPVALATRGQLPSHLALAARPLVDPERVTVSGPGSRISAVDSVRTDPLSLGDLRESGEWDLPLVEPRGLTLQEKTVKVRLQIGERATRKLGPFPVVLDPPQTDRILWIQPDEASIEVIGLREFVDSIDPAAVRIVAKVRLRPGGKAQRAGLRAVLPGWPGGVPVTVACRPESVTIRTQ